MCGANLLKNHLHSVENIVSQGTQIFKPKYSKNAPKFHASSLDDKRGSAEATIVVLAFVTSE